MAQTPPYINEVEGVAIAQNAVDSVIPGLTGGFRGEITLASSAPTTPGIYTPTASGTYTNAGNIVVDLTAGSTQLILSSNLTWSKQVTPIVLTSYTLKSDFDILNNTVGNNNINLLTSSSTTGFYTSQGVLTPGANWRNIILNVIPGYTINVKLLNVEPGPYSACCVLGYKIDNSVVAINQGSFTGNLVLASDIVKVALTSKAAIGDVYSVTQTIPVLNRMSNLETQIGNTRLGINLLTSNSQAGFYTSQGIFVASANWRSIKIDKTTDTIYVQLLNVVSPSAACIIGFKLDNSVVVISQNAITGQVSIPTDVVALALTSKAVSGDVYYVYINPVQSVTDVVQDLLSTGASASSARSLVTYLPKKIYGVIGEPVRVYPYNLVGVNDKEYSIDMFFAHKQSNEKALIIQSPTANETLSLRMRNYDGVVQNFGDIPLVVKTPVNPSSPFFILEFGDSLSFGINATFEGAIMNEVSRLFTGVGDAISNGNTAKSFTNVKVIGTLGSRPIKHEGRPGWDLNQYLNVQSNLGINNAFYNPAKSKFDLDYYLTQNGFYTAGVTSNGSNLTVVIMLNWNSVYQHTDLQFKTWYTELINLIHTSHSAAKIIILGINPPPGVNYKDYSGDRNVSRASILMDCIRYEKNLDDLETAFPTFVEHVPLIPTFCADGAYPIIALKTNLRTSATDTYYSDHVHPIDNGYGQIADIIYRAIANRL